MLISWNFSILNFVKKITPNAILIDPKQLKTNVLKLKLGIMSLLEITKPGKRRKSIIQPNTPKLLPFKIPKKITKKNIYLPI